jgi:hypothetical protein
VPQHSHAGGRPEEGVVEETERGLWKALLHGFTPEEKASLLGLVENELREQRAEVVRAAQEEVAGERPRRRPGRPRKRRRPDKA